MTRLRVIALLVCLVQFEALAGRNEQITDRERATRRFDSAAVAARRAQAIADGRVQSNTIADVVDGSRNPELFSAWELIDHLSGALRDQTSTVKYKDKWLGRGADGYLGDDFVERLRLVTGSYIDAEATLSRLQTELGKAGAEDDEALGAEWSRLNRSMCKRRADALAAGRAMFGRGTFDRFLYEAVAPDALILTSSTPSADSLLHLWQWLEGGCQ